jgi:hypothetical protein
VEQDVNPTELVMYRANSPLGVSRSRHVDLIAQRSEIIQFTDLVAYIERGELRPLRSDALGDRSADAACRSSNYDDFVTQSHIIADDRAGRGDLLMLPWSAKYARDAGRVAS